MLTHGDGIFIPLLYDTAVSTYAMCLHTPIVRPVRVQFYSRWASLRALQASTLEMTIRSVL